MHDQNRKQRKTERQKLHDNYNKFRDFYDLEKRNRKEDIGGSGNFENANATQFYFQQYVVLRNFKSILTVSLIFLGYFANKFEFDQTVDKADGIYLYVFVSLYTFLLIIIQILEYRVILKRNSLKKYLKDADVNQVYQISKFFLLIPHPNILFFRQKWIDEQTYNGEPEIRIFRRNFNEYLYLFQITWLFIQYMKTLMVNTQWANDQTDRVVRKVGFRIGDMFIIKCLMRDAQKVTVMIVLIITLFYFTIIINVIESPLFYEPIIDDGFKNFVYPSLTLWNSMITLFTVGYGDTYPVTYFGRIVVSILTILAGIILSFVTVAITTDFELTEQDSKAYSLIRSVEQKAVLQETSSDFLVKSFQQFLNKDKNNHNQELQIDLAFDSYVQANNDYKSVRMQDDLQNLYENLNDIEFNAQKYQSKFNFEILTDLIDDEKDLQRKQTFIDTQQEFLKQEEIKNSDDELQ